MRASSLVLMVMACAGLSGADPITLTLNGTSTEGNPFSGPPFEFTEHGTADFSGIGPFSFSGDGLTDPFLGLSDASLVLGHLQFQFADGDVLESKFFFFAGDLRPGLGLLPAVGELDITGGTGEFAGASGVFDLMPVSETPHGTYGFIYTWTSAGTLDLPLASVPEPSSWSLLLGALLLLCGARSLRLCAKRPGATALPLQGRVET